MKMHDTRYMRGLIPFQAYVNLPIQNRISLRKGGKKIRDFIKAVEYALYLIHASGILYPNSYTNTVFLFPPGMFL